MTQFIQEALMPCGWEGNRRSGVALAMRHRLQLFIHLRAHGYASSFTFLSTPCSQSLSPYSHTYCHRLLTMYYYWYSITHSLFHSRLKSFLFCKSSLPQPFLFLLQVSLYGFPRLFTVTSEHIRLFYFLVFFLLFLHFFSCRFRAVD